VDKKALIQAILRAADNRSRAQAEHVVDPLRYFGTVWFAEGHWCFSEQRAEISTYTATGYSSNFFNEAEFVVTKPVDEVEVKWDTYGGNNDPHN